MSLSESIDTTTAGGRLYFHMMGALAEFERSLIGERTRAGMQAARKRERAKETDARYLFRVIRDVRNNLFHGGKYQGGPAEELARDRRLVDSATHILEASVDLDVRIRWVFDEAA